MKAAKFMICPTKEEGPRLRDLQPAWLYGRVESGLSEAVSRSLG